MEDKTFFTLINQQNGHLAFKLFSFTGNGHFDHLQHNNFYSLIWIKQGEGLLRVDFSEYLFSGSQLFAFAPFQPFMFSTNHPIQGVALQFHPDFYCIHRNPQETNCDTVLFNNIYQAPFMAINTANGEQLESLFEQLSAETHRTANDSHELLVPLLKIMLVTVSRIKVASAAELPSFTEPKTPFILQNLKAAIEANFKEKHTASDYAELLHISPNALAKLVKLHYNKTLTALIAERIVIEAKRALYMTDKPIKVIAWELGYADEYYFSRFFKNNTAISPQMYRDTVGFGKALLN